MAFITVIANADMVIFRNTSDLMILIALLSISFYHCTISE
jgi:hypothetical protein